MATIIGLIHGEAGAYGISFPDFQGCVSGGETLGEALKRGREGLEFHIETLLEDGDKLPIIRDLDAVKSDPAFAEDLADSVAIVAIEAEIPSRSIRLNISLDEGLVSRIDRKAASLGVTRSSFLANAARTALISGV